ncbi:MAG: PAS domain-containing protein, partial [Sphingobacteriales bacterium]
MELVDKKYKELLAENEELRAQLEEAKDTIEAIRTGQVDAIVVENDKGHQLYTLETADQTYRLFIEKMTEGAVTLNRQGIILYCNSQFATLTGQVLSKVIGTPFSDFISPSCRQDFERLFAGAWEEDTRGEVALNNTLGTAVQLAINCLNLEDGYFLSVIVTDLTIAKENQQLLKNKNEELENINKELEQSNNDLLQFASVASHDLQEPLRKIQVFSNLLISQNRNNLNEKSITFLTKILESSDRMKQLINDILN